MTDWNNMGYADCLKYFQDDPQRLPALNSIRGGKDQPVYTLENACSMMSCLGGCDRESFEGIDRAITAELSRIEALEQAERLRGAKQS